MTRTMTKMKKSSTEISPLIHPQPSSVGPVPSKGIIHLRLIISGFMHESEMAEYQN